jgi:hypothetical protein
MRAKLLPGAVAVLVALVLSGCAGLAEISNTVSDIQEAVENGTSEDTSPPDDSDLSGLISASENEDYLLEYKIDESQVTLWYLVINSQKVDGESIAMSVLPDESGMINFTALKGGEGGEGNPFSEIVSSSQFTPGLVVTPGPSGLVYTWTNPPVNWRIEADSQNRVKSYRMESPEGIFEMDFLYGSDITKRIPQAFIDDVVAQLSTATNGMLFGVSTDDFATWDFYDF